MPTGKRHKSTAAEIAGISALAFSLFSGCGFYRLLPPPPIKDVVGRSCQEPEELLDVLSRFSISVQKHEYHHAIAMLVPEDQARMIGPDGKVPEDIKSKLNALDFKALSTDRRIDLVRGHLKGVFDCLPCLDQGVTVVVPREMPPKAVPTEPGSPEGIEMARKAMAKEFYLTIQAGRWQKASGLVHPDEWDVFLDEEKNLSELNERRLQAIEECDLDALTFKDGLLTGIVVLIEPPVSDLYLKSMIFFDLVESDRFDEAISMILESEKKFFVDGKGITRSDRMAELKALDRSEWQKLYLYHDVLLGVAEAAFGYQNL